MNSVFLEKPCVGRKCVWALLVWSAAALACTAGPEAPGPPDTRREAFLAVPEWEVGAGSQAPQPNPDVSLAAGHGVAAFFIGSPCQHGEVVLQSPASTGLGGPCPEVSNPASFVRPLREAVYVGPNGDAWWLGLPRGVVIAHGNMGNRVVARLPARGTVLAACTGDGQVISYADSLTPGVIRMYDLRKPDSAWTLTLPEEFLAADDGVWAGVQLGGAPGEPCVAIAPRAGIFAVVQGDSTVWTAPFHEPLAPPPPHGRRTGLAKLFLRRTPATPSGPLDATSYAGGIAVLYHGATPLRGRLVDLYDHLGRYRTSMILPRRTARIASTGRYLLTLSHYDRRWWLAQYRLPGTGSPQSPDTFRVRPLRPGAARPGSSQVEAAPPLP